ncbi:O-antigen ligase family protein [Candidatus Roizmanbacteria bacterium]|nr:MAG: O-antigen ligase family protein [Candidatus Roizmanbacteria bacterium]
MNTLFTQIKSDRIRKYALYVFLFFLPVQLGTFFFLPISYIDGLRIDYLAPALYMTDLLVCMLIAVHWKTIRDEIIKYTQIKWLVFASLLIVLIQIDTAIQPVIALYRTAKVIEGLFLFFIFRKSEIPAPLLLKILFSAALTQLSIALYHVLTGHSVQGGAYFLGERSFSLSTPGIAKVAISGVEVLRGYGTFSHPNSLAGFYLLLYAFVLYAPKSAGIWKYLFLGICMMLIVLSFSKVAILGVLLLSAYYAIRNLQNCTVCTLSRVTVPLVLAIIIFGTQGDTESLQKRVWLTDSAVKIITSYPWTGAGLGNYLYAQSVFPIPYTYVFLQPVHNVFLLLIAEAGIPVFFFISYVFLRYIKVYFSNPQVHAVLFVLLLTGMFDHYWLTLQQNFLLLPVVFGLLRKHEHVVK